MTSRLLRFLRGEAFMVAVILMSLEAILFAPYLTGELTATWDFLGSYNAEAFAWWHDGGFFSPPQWMPYLWGGYPAAASVQNSGWYLPVGLVAEVVPFTIRVASVLQALHVALGALGMYVLARRWRLGRPAATFALVAYFFAVGFYSNAQHVDIVRAYAWLPWILLVASPHWPWRRPWSIPAAAFVLWQAAIGSYPGILVQLVYAVVVWVVLCQVTARPSPRRYMLPLAVSGVGALLLSLLKYIPVVFVRGASGSPFTTTMLFDASIAGTLFFPFDLDFLPNDPTMRSFFIVAPVLPLALLASRRQGPVVPALGVLFTGLVLGLPSWPWAASLDLLPGMSLSRFRMADSRALVVFALIALAAAGLEALMERGAAGRRARVPLWRTVAPLAVPVAALLLAKASPFPARSWVLPFTLIAASSAVVIALALSGRAEAPMRAARTAGAFVLIFLAGVSGVLWAGSAERVWQAPRVETERAQWGATSGELMLARSEPGENLRRPARAALPEGVTPAVAFAQLWNGAYYSGNDALGGYINLAGTPSFDAIFAAVSQPGPDQSAWQSFWQSPGVVVAEPRAGAPSPETTSSCASDGACGDGLVVKPGDYAPGRWSYEITAAGPTSVVLNEAYYPGLTVRACSSAVAPDDEGCRDMPVGPGPVGSTATEVPAGAWTLTMEYSTPGQRAGWIAFWSGVALTLAAAGVQAFGSRRRTALAVPAVG